MKGGQLMATDKKNKNALINVGKNIKHFRKSMGISSMNLAELSNISHTYMKRIESDNSTSPSIDVLVSISLALNIPIDFLLRDTDHDLYKRYSDFVMLEEIKNLTDEQNSLLSNTIGLCYDLIKQKNTDE